MRGERVWNVDNTPGAIAVVHADVSAETASSYTATISGQGYSWEKSGIAPDAEQYVRLVLSNLPDGEYELSIRADTSTSSPEPFATYRLLLRGR